MNIVDILCEVFPFAPGASPNPKIIDLRQPGPSNARWAMSQGLDAETAAKFNMPTEPQRYWREAEKPMLVLTSDGGAILYYWGHANTISWEQLLKLTKQRMDTNLQNDIDVISIYRNGYLLDKSRGNSRWPGDRNRYSLDNRNIAQALLDRGLAGTNTPLWIGNWAARGGRSLGSVGRVLARPQLPQRLMLYHGTSSFRLPLIQQQGLAALPKELRVWSREYARGRPEHREDAAYLTASLDQAEYYAQKAVNKDRLYRNRVKMRGSFGNWNEPGRIEPIVLQVVLYPRDYQKLVADDDYLQHNPEATAADWMDSLSHFGQVAYRGVIPAQQIKVYQEARAA